MRVSSSLFTIAMGKISSKISFFADNWVHHQQSSAIRTITIALTNNIIDPCSQDNPTATPGHKLLMVFDFLGFQRQTSHQRYLFFISCSFLLHTQCYTKLFVYLPSCTFCVLAHRPRNMAFFIIEKYVTKRTTTSAKLSTKYHAKAW